MSTKKLLALVGLIASLALPGSVLADDSTSSDQGASADAGFCPPVDLDPSAPDPSDCQDVPRFKGSFTNQVWRFAGEANDVTLDAPMSLDFTVSGVRGLPKSLKTQDDQLVDQDGYALFSAKVKVFGPRGGRVAQSALDHADKVVVSAKLLPASRWHVDEDGYAVPTLRAKRIEILSFDAAPPAKARCQAPGDQADAGDQPAGGDQPAVAESNTGDAARARVLEAAAPCQQPQGQTGDGPVGPSIQPQQPQPPFYPEPLHISGVVAAVDQANGIVTINVGKTDSTQPKIVGRQMKFQFANGDRLEIANWSGESTPTLADLKVGYLATATIPGGTVVSFDSPTEILGISAAPFTGGGDR